MKELDEVACIQQVALSTPITPQGPPLAPFTCRFQDHFATVRFQLPIVHIRDHCHLVVVIYEVPFVPNPEFGQHCEDDLYDFCRIYFRSHRDRILVIIDPPDILLHEPMFQSDASPVLNRVAHLTFNLREVHHKNA